MSAEEWVALGAQAGLGGATLRRLLTHFGSLGAILSASAAELRAVPRIGPHMARAIQAVSRERAAELLRSLRREGIALLTWEDAGYPENLRPLYDAPPLLFLRGALLPNDAAAVAIVGTRRPTEPARRAAGEIAEALARRGLTIVSGLALGIDRAAHESALTAGGRTLAVLGSGIRRLHPSGHVELAARIAGAGAVLSEWNPDAPPAPGRLAARNRVISGLSRWVIVVESGLEGGSLRTAAFARRQGRRVAAVSGSPGTEMLLAAGAERLDWLAVDWDSLAERIRGTSLKTPARPLSAMEQLRLLEGAEAYRPAGGAH